MRKSKQKKGENIDLKIKKFEKTQKHLEKKLKQLDNKLLNIKLGLINPKIKEANLNWWMIILTFVIALSTLFTYISINKQTKAVEGSYLPQIYVSGWDCPKELKKNIPGLSNLGIANYGKIPTGVSWIFSSININITGLAIDNQGSFILVPIEYRNNEQFYFGRPLNFWLVNTSEEDAAITFIYSYQKKNKIVTNSFSCKYENNNESFILVNSDNSEKMTLSSMKLKK